MLIASVFVQHSDAGQDIKELIESITAKIQNDFALINKLNSLVCRTLGSSFEHSINVKVDRQVAQDSRRFYRHQDVCKIESSTIPSEVSEVKKSVLKRRQSLTTCG